MTPTEIPDDVLSLGRSCTSDFLLALGVEVTAQAKRQLDVLAARNIFDGILQERERCARLIENPNRSVLGIDEDALSFYTDSMARIIREGIYDARPKGSEPENHNVN